MRCPETEGKFVLCVLCAPFSYIWSMLPVGAQASSALCLTGGSIVPILTPLPRFLSSGSTGSVDESGTAQADRQCSQVQLHCHLPQSDPPQGNCLSLLS